MVKTNEPGLILTLAHGAVSLCIMLCYEVKDVRKF